MHIPQKGKRPVTIPKHEPIRKVCVLMVKEVIESEAKKMMKTLDEYLSLQYRMVLTPDPDEGGYAVSFPDLPGCLSVGDTIDEAVANAEDAKREWLAAAIEDGYPINEPDDIENYSGQFKIHSEEPA